VKSRKCCNYSINQDYFFFVEDGVEVEVFGVDVAASVVLVATLAGGAM